MIKDTTISKVFQIPSKMLQRWKNANDYRYLVYTYLQNSDEAEVEAFFRYLATKKAGSYNGSDESNLALKFLYKKDFIVLVQKHIGQYLQQNDLHIYNEKQYGSLFIEGNLPKMGESSFMAKDTGNKVIYIEIGSRVLESKPLHERLSDIKAHLKSGLYFKMMLFISNEKQLPVYLRDENIIEGVRIENISIDTFSKDYLGFNKIIFVPSTMKLPPIP